MILVGEKTGEYATLRQDEKDLYARDNDLLGRELLAMKRPDEALDRFPILRERVRNVAGVLSGGEQQMLVVSRALMGSPRVLLLDEMMTGLAHESGNALARSRACLEMLQWEVEDRPEALAELRRFADKNTVRVFCRSRCCSRA